MKLSRVVRSGALVGVGPAGLPPAELRTYETAPSYATLPNPAYRPEGSRAHRSDGLKAWDLIAGAWCDLATLAALFLPGFMTNLIAIVAGYAAGWRPGVVVYDAAFNDVSVTVSGLSSTKRYRFVVQADQVNADEFIQLQPNGSNAGCYTTWFGISQHGEQALLLLTEMAGLVASPRIMAGTVEPRAGGLSAFICHARNATGDSVYDKAICSGATSTDFTSLTLVLSATLARTGRLKMVEETP